ncbi:MAG TPA: glycoside hydrolase domain-containing protein, partial [Chloroflexota bacterium]|nr:glycoside hydrolase domain-containing protein [Chloroflexota bacterium]
MRRFVVSLILLALGLSVAWGAGDTLLRAGFEKALDADEAAGKPQATAAGAVATVPDRLGNSLFLGPKTGSLSYAAAGNIDLKQGSLIAWLQPGDWQVAGGPVTLLGARQGADALALWWEPKTTTLFFAANGGKLAVSKPAYDWVQKTAHYVILTWAPGKLAMYVDGQAAQPSKGASMPDVPADQLILGGDLGDRGTLTIRGITVLKSVLTPEQVQQRYRVAMSGQVEHERPLLTVPQCTSAPKIDGKLDDAAWNMAGGTSGFIEIAGGVLSSLGTRFYLTYDAKNIYIAFRCPSTNKPLAHKFDRDGGSPWDEDAVEMWLQPEVGFTGDYFHLVLNAAGSLWDAKNQNAAWNGTAAWAADQGDKEWTAELVVPHASLETMAPTPGTKWQANFCRDIGDGGTTNRNTAWAYTGGSGYAVWQMFGALQFLPGSPVAQVQGWTAQGTDSTVQLQLANPGPKPAKIGATVTAFRAGMSEEAQDTEGGPWTVPAGQTMAVDLSSKSPNPIDQVKLQVRNLDTNQPLLTQMVRAGTREPVSGTTVAAAPGAAAAPAAPPLTNEMLGAVLREREKWENNRIGITDKVPPPWTPMTVAGKTVSCWGRTYDYEGSLFPRQVKSQAQDLLAGPIQLVAKIGGKEVIFQKADKQSLVPAPQQVDFDAQTAAGGLTARVTSHLEYDGCIKLTLTLTAANNKPVEIQGLELRIPVRADRALYYHWFEATRDPRLTNAGALPKDGLKGHFKPLLWLGDNDRGLCWFSESPKGWQNNDKESILRVERQADTAVMRICMADRPYVIASSWQTVFGLQATPTRPTTPGWRDWLIPLNQTNPWGSWGPGFNNLSGTDDEGTLMP